MECRYQMEYNNDQTPLQLMPKVFRLCFMLRSLCVNQIKVNPDSRNQSVVEVELNVTLRTEYNREGKMETKRHLKVNRQIFLDEEWNGPESLSFSVVKKRVCLLIFIGAPQNLVKWSLFNGEKDRYSLHKIRSDKFVHYSC